MADWHSVSVGGCTWGYRELYRAYTRIVNDSRQRRKAFIYLSDLEQSGIVDGFIFDGLGVCYIQGSGCKRDEHLAMMYYQRALDLSFPLGILVHSHSRWTGNAHVAPDRDICVQLALQAEEKGMRDDRILNMLLCRLRIRSYSPDSQVLGKFKNRKEMALHYCDVLIDRKSPRGYLRKADFYCHGYADVPTDFYKALSLWEDADRLGLAHWDTYFKFLDEAWYAFSLPLYCIRRHIFHCLISHWAIGMLYCLSCDSVYIYAQPFLPFSLRISY